MAYRKLSTATKTGTHLDQLKTLASILAKAIDDPAENDNVASLARQYRDTIKEIETIEGTDSNDDDIAGILSSRAADGKAGAVR
ncbi:MAG: hypothetical protein J6D53_01590 [Blautia sp.]|nr:hypothetical protein [Blautia sp.]